MKLCYTFEVNVELFFYVLDFGLDRSDGRYAAEPHFNNTPTLSGATYVQNLELQQQSFPLCKRSSAIWRIVVDHTSILKRRYQHR